MHDITLGELFENKRKELGYTKKEVCDGLCSSATYGRYEENITIPENYILVYLLERLSVDPINMKILCTNVESDEIIIIRKIINDYNMHNNNQLLTEAKDFLSTAGIKKNKLLTQFLLLYYAKASLNISESNYAKDILKEAFSITKGKLADREKNLIFSSVEFEIYIFLKFIDDKIDDLIAIYRKLRSFDYYHVLRKKYSDLMARLIYKTNCAEDIKLQILNECLLYNKKIGRLKEIKEMLFLRDHICHKENDLILRKLEYISKEVHEECQYC